MSKQVRILFLVLCIECLVLGGFYFAKSMKPRPPKFSEIGVNAFTKVDLQQSASRCRTPDDFETIAAQYMASGFFAEAATSYAHAVKLNPNSADLAYKNGFCLSRFGRLEESNSEFERAIELKYRKAADAMYFIGRNHLRAEDPDKALEAFRKANKLPVAKFEQAKILFRKQKYEAAKELLGEVSAVEPRRVRATNLLYRIYEAQGDKGKALFASLDATTHWLRLSTPFKTENDAVKRVAGGFGIGKKDIKSQELIGRKDYDGARRVLKEMQDEEWSVGAQDNLIKISSLTSRLIDARGFVEERFERFGTSSGILLVLGNLEDINGKRGNALKLWQQGLEIRSDSGAVECAEQLAKHYFAAGDRKKGNEYTFIVEASKIESACKLDNYPRAYAVARTMLQQNPNNPEALYYFGRACVGVFKASEGIKALKQCLQLDPSHGKARQVLKTLQSQ